MPSNVLSVVAHEVAHIQRVPKSFVALKRLGKQGQIDQSLAFAGLRFSVRVGRAASECAQGHAVGIFQQFAFPGVPHFGRGTADVCHGQQIQRGEVAFIAHALGKGGHHVRVAQIFFLSHMAHGQVLSDQKFDQLAVFFGYVVAFAKTAYFQAAQLRMVTATAFGNVVK